MSPNATFAVIIPVGPSAVDLARGAALLSCLVYWEPQVRWCIILDNSVMNRGLAELPYVPTTCQVVTLTTSQRYTGHSWGGVLTSRVLSAFAYVQAHTDAAFALRIDTDALVIAPFVNKISSLLAQRPFAGLVGTVGLSCNPLIRAHDDLTRTPKLLSLHRLLPRDTLHDESAASDIHVHDLGTLSTAQQSAFQLLRGHIDHAVQHGYSTSEFCQGGGYVVTRLMLDRMSAAGYLQSAESWKILPFSEDRVVAMYTRAVGLEMYDCSRQNEPFGMNHVGLAYPPDTLRARGHSIIHSVRNDPRFDEASIRRFFATL